MAAARWVTPAGLREMVEADAFFFYPELWQVLEQVRELLWAGGRRTGQWPAAGS